LTRSYIIRVRYILVSHFCFPSPSATCAVAAAAAAEKATNGLGKGHLKAENQEAVDLLVKVFRDHADNLPATPSEPTRQVERSRGRQTLQLKEGHDRPRQCDGADNVAKVGGDLSGYAGLQV